MYSKNDVKEFIEMLEGSSLSVLEIKNGDGSAIRLEKAISAAPAVVMQANAPNFAPIVLLSGSLRDSAMVPI